MTQIRNKTFIVISLGLLTMAIAACKEEQSPLPVPVHVNKPTPPVQKQLSTSKSTSPTVSLDFSNRKDPFKPFVPQPITPQGGQISDSQVSELLPIQAYELGKYKVAGIIVGLKENSALVIDPEGKGYVVKPGMLIGNSQGRITKISPSEIEVAEKYREDNGKIKSRVEKLTLPKKK